jgi:membrane protease YdiL (CAAX protease family)
VGVPIAARGLSLAGAIAIVALVVVPAVSAIGSSPWVAAAGFIAGLPFLAVLTWIAATPDHADRKLSRLGLDLTKGRHLVALAIHLAFAWIVFGMTIIQTGQALSRYLATGQHPATGQELGGIGIVLQLVLSLILFVVAALSWLWLVDGLDLKGIVDEMRMDLDDFPSGAVYGVLATLAGFVVLAGLSFAMQQLGIEPSNPQAEAIADALSWETALVVAAMAGLGEEIYFRGFLLDRVGNLAQASLFAIVHATYLTAFQVLLPFALGLAFGWLVRKTNLWTAIVSHTTFNAVMLLAQIYAGEDGGLAILALFGF